MVTNEEILKIKDRIISAVDVEKLYLFGSYAYGTPYKDSDYDFYMVIPNNSGIRPIDASIEARSVLWDMEVGAVDILAGTVEIFNRRSQQVTLEPRLLMRGFCFMNDEYIGTVEEWIRLVDMDLSTAKRIFETHHPIPIEIVCFHFLRFRIRQ